MMATISGRPSMPELLDPAGSTLVPAKAMTAHFTVITG